MVKAISKESNQKKMLRKLWKDYESLVLRHNGRVDLDDPERWALEILLADLIEIVDEKIDETEACVDDQVDLARLLVEQRKLDAEKDSNSG